MPAVGFLSELVCGNQKFPRPLWPFRPFSTVSRTSTGAPAVLFVPQNESVQENIECKNTRRALLLNRGCCAPAGSSPPLCLVSCPVATTVSYNRSILNLKKVGRYSDSDEKSSLEKKKRFEIMADLLEEEVVYLS